MLTVLDAGFAAKVSPYLVLGRTKKEKLMLGSYLIVISENEVHFREVLMIHTCADLQKTLQEIYWKSCMEEKAIELFHWE